jgi:hypothetical protein
MINISSSLIAGFYDYRYNLNHITKPYMAPTPIWLFTHPLLMQFLRKLDSLPVLDVKLIAGSS